MKKPVLFNAGDIINHKVFGEGIIVDVVPREDGVPLVFVVFKSEPRTRRRFSTLSIRDYLV